ncbi:MAG: hypothetical protein JO010_05350, partial [Alphaproteobacteria bacterium]|nr:hypothetical protein [Alphaproteobacteria bacterium]
MSLAALREDAPAAGAASRRLLICSAGIPHESDGASTVLFYHYIAVLKREGYRILHLLLLEGDGWPDAAVARYAERMAEGERFA